MIKIPNQGNLDKVRAVSTKMSRRVAAVLAITPLTLGLLVATATASYASGTYRTTAAVNVHQASNVAQAPSTSTPVITTEPNGSSFALICQWQGSTNVGGNATWDLVTFSNGITGGISDYYTTSPSFNSFVPGTGACGSSPAPAPALGIGGVDMQRACDTQYPGRGLRAVVTNSSSAYSWICSGPGVSAGINVNAECATQYGYGAVSGLANASNPYTWYCQWNVTGQMQAAANWAISEKNSPQPNYSDHYGHLWSGWCEEFAEQAEGFKFVFASATADYAWEAQQGRIHTDANPPLGALVFYGGGVNGHVAVSLGNDQEIGTYGLSGQNYPVMQYPVTGYLTNNYLGWAVPQGS